MFGLDKNEVTQHSNICKPCLNPNLNKPIVKRHSETMMEFASRYDAKREGKK